MIGPSEVQGCPWGLQWECSGNYCQAQPQLQVKLSLKAELALISVKPAAHPCHPGHPPTHPRHLRLGKLIFQHFSVNVDQVSFQEYSRNPIGRRPQFFRQMEDDLNFLDKWKTTSIFQTNGRRPQFVGNGIQPQFVANRRQP